MSILKVNTIQKKDGTQFPLIGQVVSNVFTSNTSTSSTSFVTTSHSVSITPTSTSSKIWVIYSGTGDTQAGAVQCFATLYRDSTNLAAGGGLQNTWEAANRQIAPFCMNYVDSPATTSPVTYTAYCRSSGGTSIVFGAIDGSYAYMTLMEVLA